MIGSYIIGITGIVLMMITWAAVQHIWKKVFSDNIIDEDPLAHRTTCGNCNCTTVCSNKLKK